MSEKVAVPRRPPLQVAMGPDQHLRVGPGGYIRVDAASVAFAAAVIDDLCRVAMAPEGRALLAECDALGRVIRIVRPETSIDPPNGTVEADSRRDATSAGRDIGQRTSDGEPVAGTGAGSGSRISYDPEEWPWQGDPASPTGARVLAALLRQARINARGADDPADLWPRLSDGGR